MESNLQKLRAIESHLLDPELGVRLFEVIPDALVIVDSCAVIQLVNQQAELLFGYHRTELYDQPVELLIPEAARERHVTHRDAYMQEPRTRPMGLGMTLKARQKNGSEFIAEINLSPIVTRQGFYVLAAIRKQRDHQCQATRSETNLGLSTGS